MSESVSTNEQKSSGTTTVGTCKLRIRLKAKTTQKVEEIRKLKHILKIRPHTELEAHRLLLAVSTNNTERVQNLLESGVSANSADRQRRSALHLATSRGYVEIVRLLLQYGADPNRLDIIHNTPLHLAACLNNFQIIKMLLDAGADVRSLDVYGRNPLQLAESKLQLLKRSLKEGAIEMIQLRSQIQQVCLGHRSSY